ncbi:nucleotide sugar dehydrogenase [Microbacterium marinilacus]|uniref:Nucleotide sugar dehydrogenase n=1 Tax=Microbacterium marinilacus TaxID=415209 RepID=A0ABP7BDQ3_9MICO|nr:nucleotide sugar dehydrogenase [Microbacterium marinilacus]MBY0689429.1 nucleotide sugar dehydrogenase [Microbacterium marinilacus]
MSTAPELVAVVGQGYVGLPLAMRAVEAGYNVVGIDLDQSRVDALTQGSSYVEDISSEAVRSALDSGRYVATDDYARAHAFHVAVITVPTPLRETLPDLSFIESAGASLAGQLTPGATVVLESTTYPGTTQELLVPILESGSGLKAGVDFFVGYSPERIDPGNQTYTFVNTPKVVSGIDTQSLERVQAFYSSLVDVTVPVSTTKEAELTKLLENTFRHVNIALVNELAIFAHQLGVNVWEAIDAAATKPFGFMKFTPGPGVGGHCLPVDPSYLSWQVRRSLGQSFRFVDLANEVNEHMPDYVVQRAIELLNRSRKSLNGSRILVVGVAYKKNSGDSREAPALRIIELLSGYGASVSAADPLVEDHRWPAGARRVVLDSDEVRDADLIVIVTDHDEFDLELLRDTDTPVLDTRNSLGHVTDGTL